MNQRHDPASFIPQSLEAEQALLGAMLLNSDVYLAVADIVEADHMYEPLHSTLYAIMAERIVRGENVTPITLAAAIGKDAAVDVAHGLTVGEYLSRLAGEAISESATYAIDYAKTIRDLWARRRIITMARDLQNRALGGVADEGIEALLDEADQELSTIRFGKQIDGVRTLGEFADRAIELTAAAYQATAKIGFDTGIGSIDELMGPIMPGDLVTLIGPSGGGKSALAFQILCRNCEPSLDANRGGSGFFLSQEMGGAQVARRVMATQTGISTRAQRGGEVLEAEYGFLRDSAARIKSIPVYVDDSGRQTTSRIIRKLRAMKKRYGIKIAAIDHLRIIRPENNRMGKIDTIEHAAAELKDAAKDMDIAIIALAQVTTESQKRETWKVRAEDAWGGDHLKQCSDVVMTVTLPHKWLRSHEPPEGSRDRAQWETNLLRWEGKAEIGFPKIRDGDDGRTCVVSFSGPRMLFAD